MPKLKCKYGHDTSQTGSRNPRNGECLQCYEERKVTYRPKYMKQYRTTEFAKERKKIYDSTYRKSDKGKLAEKKYKVSDKRKETNHRYKVSEKGRISDKRFKSSEKGIEIMKIWRASESGRYSHLKSDIRYHIKDKTQKILNLEEELKEFLNESVL